MINKDNKEKIISREQKVATLERQYKINHTLCGICELLEHDRELTNNEFSMNFDTYKIGAQFFESIFTCQEVLKLGYHSDILTDRKVFIFLLDTNEILKIEICGRSSSVNTDCTISVHTTKILEAIAHNYDGEICDYDPYYYDHSKIPVTFFTFVDRSGSAIRANNPSYCFMNEYQSTNLLESLEGRDIREILTPISVDDFISRILSANTDKLLPEEKTSSRTRSRNKLTY